MSIDENLKFAPSHEWVRVEGNKAYVGISDHAQESLGDIIFAEVDVPEIGDDVNRGEEVATVESVKAASAIYSPVSGKLVELNSALNDEPQAINEKPYETFIFAIEMSEPSQLDELMDAGAYQEMLEKAEDD